MERLTYGALRCRKPQMSEHRGRTWDQAGDLVNRISLAGVPFVGGPPLPSVDTKDARISLPAYLRG